MRADAARARRRPNSVGSASLREELARAGGAELAEVLEPRLVAAGEAYGRDRFGDALRMVRPLLRAAPELAAAQELAGLALYRLGRFEEALRHLRRYTELSQSVDQYPVLADCERALGRHDRVTELWGGLRQAGVGADLLAEGRMVAAGSLADRGDLAAAIQLLAPSAGRDVRHPAARHLRQWYALGDLYERAGDLPRARELMRRVAAHDPELADVAERVASLR
jgi:tetratricopeptide (TPR) repeat protein